MKSILRLTGVVSGPFSWQWRTDVGGMRYDIIGFGRNRTFGQPQESGSFAKKTEYREDYLLVESYVDECFSGLVKPSSREQSESCAIFPGGLCDLPRATVSGPQTQLNKWRECLLYTSMGYSWGRIFLIGGDRRRPRRLSLRLSPRSCKSQRMRSRLRR